MSDIRRVLKPSVWVFYAVFVLEILFMISPAALYFYGVYGPVLNVFHRWAATREAGIYRFSIGNSGRSRRTARHTAPPPIPPAARTGTAW